MANLPIIRRPSVRVSSFSFMNRPQLPPREGVETARNTNTIRQQQQALVNINSGLASLSLQLQALNQSITDISIQIKGDAVLDDIREQERLKRERTLAEQKIRQGKEGTIERKLQSVLQKPLQKIGAKANFTLAKLGQFFTILLGGFLANRAIQFISALAQGNKEKLKEITDKIVGELAQVAALFLLINGGLGLALTGLLRFGSFVTRLAFRNLIARPFGMAFRFLQRQVGRAFNLVSGLGGVGGLGGGGGTNVTGGNRLGLSQTQNFKQLPPTKQVPLISGGKNAVTTTRPRFSMGGLFGSMGFDMLTGRPLGETIAGNAFASTALFGAALAGAKITVPAAIVSYMILNTIGGMGFNATGLQNTELGGFRFQTPISDFFDNIIELANSLSVFPSIDLYNFLNSDDVKNLSPAAVFLNLPSFKSFINLLAFFSVLKYCVGSVSTAYSPFLGPLVTKPAS